MPKKPEIFMVAILLLSVLVLLPSCVSKKKLEEANQQVQSLQAKVADLEKSLSEKESAINQLKKENADVQAQLPESYEVKKGDNHWKIAFDFLTKKGVAEEAAKKMLYKVALFEPLQVGFNVINFFSGGVFGTFVSQGAATVSPGALMRFQKKKAEEERLALESQIASLKQQIDELNKKIVNVENEKEAVTREFNAKIDALNKEIKGFQEQTKDLDSKLNSVYYLADTKDSLKAKGKIKGSFLGICGTKVGQVTFADFNGRLDLREKDAIELQAADLGVTTIKKVSLLPRELEANKDYRAEILDRGARARIVLVEKDKFRLGRILIYVN
jgi:outer membrane murein-binding lipoprotein Lpp